MRRTHPLGLLAAVALVLLPSPGARAGDPAAEAVERLSREWEGADDVARQLLADGVAGSPDPRGLAALSDVARTSFQRSESMRLKRLELEARIDAASDPAAPPGAAAEAAAMRKDVGVLAKLDAREARGREFLGASLPRVLDGLSDSAFEGAAPDALRRALKGAPPGLSTWLAAGLGAARKERTAPLFVALAADALKDHRKQTADRAAPARRLEQVNARIADALDRFLAEQQKKGDISGRVPAGLLGNLDQEKAEAEREVLKFQRAMDEADARRLAMRSALSGMLRAAEPAARERLLDLVERKVMADPDPDLRAFGVGALGGAPGERGAGLLKVALSDPDVRIVVAALDALGERDEPESVEILRAKLYDARWPVRAAAVASLGRTGRAAAVPPLLEALATAKGRDLDDLREALAALTGKSFAAAADPWKAWWARAGATFRGPKEAPAEPPPAGEASGAPPREGLDVEGDGTTFYGIETHSTRVLYVLDFSGSMMWRGSEAEGTSKTKVDVLREEMRKSLTGLPDGARFHLISFSSGVTVWKKGPAVRDRASLADALKWLEGAKAIGSTNIYDALEKAFEVVGGKDRGPEPAFDTIFFMTDGKPTSGKVTDPRLILGDVRRWNEARKVRVHVVGVGGHGRNLPAGAQGADDLDESFLKSLAEQNGGQCVIR